VVRGDNELATNRCREIRNEHVIVAEPLDSASALTSRGLISVPSVQVVVDNNLGQHGVRGGVKDCDHGRLTIV